MKQIYSAYNKYLTNSSHILSYVLKNGKRLSGKYKTLY